LDRPVDNRVEHPVFFVETEERCSRGARCGRDLLELRMNPSRLIPLLGLVLFVMLTVSYRAIGWSIVDWKIAHDFPQVKRITPAELSAWLQDAGRPPPALLDVRTAAEYEVSHLQNARRVQPGSPASIIQLPKDQPIVTYCSIGYRSGALARTLDRAGFTHVSNMEGSIFKWANEGRPVYCHGQQVKKVHPYNERWGKLLDKALRAEVTSSAR
jgi:rhodanese-related sulfurtransferase